MIGESFELSTGVAADEAEEGDGMFDAGLANEGRGFPQDKHSLPLTPSVPQLGQKTIVRSENASIHWFDKMQRNNEREGFAVEAGFKSTQLQLQILDLTFCGPCSII